MSGSAARVHMEPDEATTDIYQKILEFPQNPKGKHHSW
jgi:hypothetical protein